MINKLISGFEIDLNIKSILEDFHANGPVDRSNLEILSYYKKFHREKFVFFEKRLLYLMGLFYKTSCPTSFVEEIYSLYAKTIESESGRRFTPVQAGIFKSISEKRFYSFSAPTSAGKSYLFRELIQDSENDIVIVVPSRSLISEYYFEIIGLVDKNVLVHQFVDNVNTAICNRRIFIITPERSAELFKRKDEFNIDFFLLDEAQLSEEGFRGLRFDAFVRRVANKFPYSKLIFAHPFVENPEAQLEKHGFNTDSSSHSFAQQASGKIFMQYDGQDFQFFSPNFESSIVTYDRNIAHEILSNNGTMLIYISKSKIYSGEYIAQFSEYINRCHRIESRDAIDIIEELKVFIGASDPGTERHSNLIGLMRVGVVTHHGSMPLKARLIVERFIKEGHARICFSTSTLNQGINMPFDIVWVDNFNQVKDLTLKNLIGRSGRTSREVDSFDFGYVVVNKKNTSSFIRRYKENYYISNTSSLDLDTSIIDEDWRDLVEAIKDDAFDDEKHLPEIQIERISKSSVNSSVKHILDMLLPDGKPITGDEYYNIQNQDRKELKTKFSTIFTKHLRRKELTRAEKSVLSAAIPILLWHIQGRSFSQIVALRHSYITSKTERRKILSLLKKNMITSVDAKRRLNKIKLIYTPFPSSIPNKSLAPQPTFDTSAKYDTLDYDSLVYDTYDYLDKVISFSMVDPLCAVFDNYYDTFHDQRAKIMSMYIRFGTCDEIDIWLLRYGFSFEDIEWIKEHVERIDSTRIYFYDTVHSLTKDRIGRIERYL